MGITKSRKGLALVLVGTILGTMLFSCKKKEQEIVGKSGAESAKTQSLEKPVLGELQVQIKEAQQVNPKVKAWLVVPGTDISEPVIFDPDEDNAYWENRNLQGEQVEQKPGDYKDTVVYASYRDRFGDHYEEDAPNNVIFGHNWTNITPPFVIGADPKEKMFAQLPSFTDTGFSEKYQYLYLATEREMRVYKVFSAMYSEKDWTDELGFNYLDPEPSKENFATMVEEMQKRSVLNFHTDVSAEDQLLTLSTCSRFVSGAGADQRYVVVGRMVRDGEEPDALTRVESNPDWKQPSF